MLSAILFVTLLVSSCYNQKKATQQVYKAHATYPIVLARYCAITYPVTESVQYIPGKDSLIYNYVTVDCDSAFEAALAQLKNETGKELEPIIITRPCPPSRNRVDTFIKIQRDSAGMAVLHLTIDSLKQVIAKKNGEIANLDNKVTAKNKTILYLSIGAGILALILGLIFYKKLN